MLERIWQAVYHTPWRHGTPLQTLWTSGSCKTIRNTLRCHKWCKTAVSRKFSSPAASCNFTRVRQNCCWNGPVHLRHQYRTVWDRSLPPGYSLGSLRMAGGVADSASLNGSPNSLLISVVRWLGISNSYYGLLAVSVPDRRFVLYLLMHTLLQTEFDNEGNWRSQVIRKSELLFRYGIQARDIRFSTLSSLFVRADSIILRLQHIKAIINTDSFVLLDSDHPAIQEFIPELQERLRARADQESLPFEFRALEAMLMKIFSVLDERFRDLAPALRDVLNSLLDPRLFSVDRGELHVLLHHSKSMSEFHSIIRDIEATLTDMLDSEEDMADMYLTHWAITRKQRDLHDIEEINSILEAYLMQAENIMSEIQKLRELIDQSESIILINLDSQRNIMLRLGLQLEMGMFSAAISGLIGVAFGMNLDSSLEENTFAFWVVTGMMVTGCGLLWRRLLTFLGKNLDKPSLKRLTKPKTKK